ncbi:hypothetical protein V8E51_012833 [Hyaloscypha variabilis]
MPFSSLIYSREAFTFIPSTSSESYSLLSSEPDLRHFIYYLDFKLLLCATCKSAVSQDYIKGHIFKHISTYKGKAKVSKATSFATTLLSSFEVKSVSKSLELVLDFQATIDTFFRFQELETTSFYKCITCSSLFRSQQNIQRHRAQEHASLKLDPYYIVIKGQSLEPTRYFFELQLKEKGVKVNLSSPRPTSPRPPRLEAENVPSSPTLDPLEEAKRAFLSSFSQKEAVYLTKLGSFSLDPAEKLTPFQIKTRYVEYIHKYNINDLVELCAPLKEGESVLEVLAVNLKEMLYLSLEKVTFLNKSHLNILNSFEASKTRNKPFKPLLNSETRVRYFGFFSTPEESSTARILKQIKLINHSKDLTSVEIKEYLLDIIIRLFNQRLDLDIFDSPISCFFASISIRPKERSIRDTLDLSQYYSRFIYSSQLIIIEASFQALLRGSNLELNTIITTFMSSCLVNTASTALSEILLHRSYCFQVNRETSTTNFLSISPTLKETISYNKVTISVDNLRTLFSSLISSTFSFLTDELLLSISKSKYSSITLEEFSKYEDRSITTPYKCFRDFSPNLATSSRFIQDEIFKDRLLLERFFEFNDSILSLNKKQVALYLKHILEFKKRCFLLVYLTSGLPLRGTELATLRYLNSIKDKREIFLDISSNLFIINISYHKAQGLSEKKASGIRYLPPSVSLIFLLYIVLVDPFTTFLNINTQSPKAVLKSKSLIPYFFFTDQRLLTSRDLSLKLSASSSLVLGQKLGIQTYRQVIIGIIKLFMRENLDASTLLLEEEESNTSRIRASQSNHSSSVEDFNYARSSLVFSNISATFQFKYLQFCLRYFSFFRIDNNEVLVDSYISQLAVYNNQARSSTLGVVNSLAIRYNKAISIETSSAIPTTSRKHSRQVSSITSSSALVAKRFDRRYE